MNMADRIGETIKGLEVPPETRAVAAVEPPEVSGELRPRCFAEFVGNELARAQVEAAVTTSRRDGEPLPHMLFVGAPGMGKTSLAHVAALEYGARCWIYSGTAVEDLTDFALALLNLRENDVIFVDEIHAMPHRLAEAWYSAMEDFYIDAPRKKFMHQGQEIILRSGTIPRFALIAATTNAGGMTKPLLDRFSLRIRLKPYTAEQLAQIVTQAAPRLARMVTPEAAAAIAQRAKNTPRLALELLKAARLWSAPDAPIDTEAILTTCHYREIDERGLDALDREYLAALAGSRIPLGLTTLSGRLDESPRTIEIIVEPFLLRQGWIMKSPRGRVLTPAGREIAT